MSQKSKICLLIAGLAIVIACGIQANRPGSSEDPQPLKSAPPASQPKAEAPRLVVLAAGETLGNLEPCQCVEGMWGGFPRRLAMVRRLQARGLPLLLIDGGDLTGKAYHPALLEAKTEAALELLAESGVSAMAVGERDLRLGVEKLSLLSTQSGVALLAANLSYASESKVGQQPFPGHRWVDVAGQPVLLLGALDPELGDPTGELSITPPGPALHKALQAALQEAPPAKQTPLRVLLFHGSAESARAAAKTLEGIDLVVCGHDQVKALPTSALGSARLIETLRDARSLAQIEIRSAGLKLTHLPLDEHIPDDSWARARVERYYEDVRTLPEPPRKQTEGGYFVGAEGCMSCHQEAYQVFRKTRHHQAYAHVLKKDPKRASLQECIGCHVTGYGFESGYLDNEQTPELAEVSCESCHGVGGNHVQRGGAKGFGLRVNFPDSWRPLCVSCHDASNSPNFDFPSAMARIKHWKDRGK